MINRRDVIRRSASAGVAIALPSQAQPNNRIVLGQPATSPDRRPSSAFREQGRAFYFDALDASGGLNGTSLELKTLDDGYEPDRLESIRDAASAASRSTSARATTSP